MLDKWIEELKKGNCISEPDLKKLCIQVRVGFLISGYVQLIIECK